jgi:hypothetical protein
LPFAAKVALAPGRHRVVFEFKYDGSGTGKGGTGTLSADGKQVAKGRIEATVPYRFSGDETFDVGEDTGTQAFMEAMDVAHYGMNAGKEPVRVLAVYMGAKGAKDVIPVK